MQSRRFVTGLASLAIISAILCAIALAAVTARREERLLMSAHYQQKAAESLIAARTERFTADLAEGKIQSPILPFLNPIGEPGPHRAAAAASEARSIEYSRIGRQYEDAASRPWRSVDAATRLP
jgi:hypothetical protein